MDTARLTDAQTGLGCASSLRAAVASPGFAAKQPCNPNFNVILCRNLGYGDRADSRRAGEQPNIRACDDVTKALTALDPAFYWRAINSMPRE